MLIQTIGSVEVEDISQVFQGLEAFLSDDWQRSPRLSETNPSVNADSDTFHVTRIDHPKTLDRGFILL
jgi:hypothetical protein